MDVGKHLAKATRNKHFLVNHLTGIIEKCPDWASVVAFYSALHFVDAYLKKQHNIDFAHHAERLRFMSVNVVEIYAAYSRLFDLGFDSRYKSVADMPCRDEVLSAINFDLKDVEEFVMSRI